MAKIQYNVGTRKVGSDTLNVYSAKTGSDETAILVEKQSDDSFKFLSRSAFGNAIALQTATVSSVVDIAQYADTPPSSVGANGVVTVDNEDSANPLPRLYADQAFFSLRGTGVEKYEGDTGYPVSGTNARISLVNARTDSAKTVTEYIEQATQWAAKNPLLLAAIVFLLLELFGITNFLGISLKKKKGRVRRR